ncbi:hypothetical protein AB0F17_47630 [Nonomuraea sp. NPDC026600]|uniref:hypothetical protein n=1 Tax=Nonomuraea sp. NPDC026600 TaxID=3155363 RepID=UPI0033F8C3BA
MTQLINEIKRLHQSWPEADVQIDSALRAIGKSLSGPGLLKDIAFQVAERVPDLQRRLDLIVATQKIGLDKGTIWADESLWVSHTPEGGAAAAKAVADELRLARKNSPFLKEPLSDKTLEALEKHQQDPYFAIALAKEMPPKELKELLAGLVHTQTGHRNGDQNNESLSGADRLLRTLSITLGTASRGVGDMKLPKDYVDQLIGSQGEAGAGLMAGELLRHGTFDDAFLHDLVNKVYDNAHEESANRKEIIAFGPGVAAALANNPRVAQDFLTDQVRKPLAFLMQQHTWGGESQELGRAIVAATTTYRDHTQPPGSSRGYKSALIASWAIHFWSDKKTQWNLPQTQQSAARVLAAYISDVHRTPGGNTKETMGVTPLADPDMNLPGAQPYGALLEEQSTKKTLTWALSDPAALKTVVEGHGKYSLMVLEAQAAQIQEINRKALAAWHNSHPDATKAELSAQRQKILEDAMAGSAAKEFKAKVFNLSASLYLIANAGNIANINEADRRDAAHDAFKDAVISTLKLTLTPAGDWVAAGYEHLDTNFSDGIQFKEGKGARSDATTALATSEDLFKDLVANAMLRHGMFGDESTVGSKHPHAFKNYAKGSDGNFLRGEQIIPRSDMSATEDFAYRQWQRDAASSIFDDIDRSVKDGFRPQGPPLDLRDDE